MFLHVGGVNHANDDLLEEIENCPGRIAAAQHLKTRKELLGMQPFPFEHEQWVSHTGYELEAMNGGQAESIPVILEVDAALHLVQCVKARKWPTRAPWLLLEEPEEDERRYGGAPFITPSKLSENAPWPGGTKIQPPHPMEAVSDFKRPHHRHRDHRNH